MYVYVQIVFIHTWIIYQDICTLIFANIFLLQVNKSVVVVEYFHLLNQLHLLKLDDIRLPESSEAHEGLVKKTKFAKRLTGGHLKCLRKVDRM